MNLEAGQQLLHYRLVEKLGEGGMGVVWKATDTHLDRDVAIKVLPVQFSQEAERLARFEREAKLLASLDHPNIATVYGLHPSKIADEPSFIAMEYIPGEDLAQRLARGPIAVDEALAIAQSVAEALEAAHDSGVIHRDLKPANVQLTADGKVKVLDFGLAKAFEADPMSGTNPSLSPTVTSAGTVAGVILGTASYMSPEQAKGRPVDRRADIWAFGVLVSEMLCGRRMFDAETVSETLAKVLMTEVDLSELPPSTPSAIRRLLGRCLDRDPDRRLRDIGEARIVLEDVRSGTVDEEVIVGPERPSRAKRSTAGRWLPWLVAGVAVVAAVYLGTSGPSEDPVPARRIETSILPPEENGFDVRSGFSLSADGSRLAFTTRRPGEQGMLWIRDLSSTAARPLEGTEGAQSPFWSPTGSHVVFYSANKVRKITLETGLIETLAEAPYVGGGAWGPDGSILLTRGWGRGMQKISASGSGSEQLVAQDRAGQDLIVWPFFLPDGRHFLYLVRRYGSDQSTGEVRVSSLNGEVDKLLLYANSNAVYVDPGYLIWWQEGNLRSQRFDAERLELIGESEGFIRNVRFNPSRGKMAVSVSGNGLLVYQAGESQFGDELVLVDREGNVIRQVGGSGSYYGPRLSADGSRIVLDISDETNRGDVWVLDVARGSGTRVTTFSEDDSRTRWSPDGRQIAFSSSRNVDWSAIWISDRRTGAEPRQLLADPEANLDPNDWTTTGYLLLERTTDDDHDLYLYSFEDEKMTPWLTTRFVERAAVATPDGRFAAYVSDETGQPEVWLQTFPTLGERWRVSVEGGDWPSWRSDGNELYYLDPSGQMMAVPVTWIDDEAGRVPELGVPQPLFRAEFKEHDDRQYDTRDGQTFLLNRLVADSLRDPLTLVQNWQ